MRHRSVVIPRHRPPALQPRKRWLVVCALAFCAGMALVGCENSTGPGWVCSWCPATCTWTRDTLVSAITNDTVYADVAFCTGRLDPDTLVAPWEVAQ